MGKKRLDSLLVDRGLAPSRKRAQALILAGLVRANGLSTHKAGTLVDEAADLHIQQPFPFVGRGALKLDHALLAFSLDVTDFVALDVGASTGGFTDCLLQRGAKKVYALDVGYGQLDLKLRNDPRVAVMERVNAHHHFTLPESIDIATVDVSFISVRKVIPNIIPLLKDTGSLIILLKPQFEAQRKQVKRGGLVKDPLVHAEVLGIAVIWAISKGLQLKGIVPSPVLGTKGNQEFLILMNKVP